MTSTAAWAARRVSTNEDSMKKRIPKVRMAKPTGRPIQLRYTDPATGKEVRITTATHDPIVAEQEKSKLEAKLLLGIDAKPRRRKGGASMDWEEFREQYTKLQLDSLREKSAIDAESRLDIAERILKPRILSDLATGEALHELQAKLLMGAEGTKGPRAQYTVRNYMGAVVAALNWAETMGWLPSVPKLAKIKVAKLAHEGPANLRGRVRRNAGSRQKRSRRRRCPLVEIPTSRLVGVGASAR